MKVALYALIIMTLPVFASAQELYQDVQNTWRAEVIEVSDEHTVTVPGSDVENSVQTLTVRFLEGEREGEWVTFENDYIQLDEGDRFYLNHLKTIDGREYYLVREVDRKGAMAIVFALFAGVVLLFGGMQGFRSLLSLAGSLLVIVYILVPHLVSGAAPIPLSILVAGLILFFAIFFTHGFNKGSTVAFLGTMSAVVLTGILAYWSVAFTGLTGFTSDETTYLNLNTGGQLDFVGLLLAAIIIGALGALDDIAVTQVAVVRELRDANEKLSRREVYTKALRVGKEHVGALVNTLVLAYTGAALPLMLLFALSDSSIVSIMNREIFATEIIRSLVGSIGLVLTVPITTLLAVFLMQKGDKAPHAHTH
ncbi:YibE/F family protein [Candidatus Kaiserbacteria bacterium]|nr:YibE/F family protein [Candidatus Kaiserbacteria bacterium]